jgi:hypothetical protein
MSPERLSDRFGSRPSLPYYSKPPLPSGMAPP